MDHSWLLVNTVLAWIPVALAALLFTVRPDARRGVLWWAGAVAFVMFLPNAPYVVTDLVHLRSDLGAEDERVVTRVLPVYVAFIASGFLAYYLSLLQLRRYLVRHGLAARVPAVILGLHAVVAVGIFLGRASRLNSWEPVVHPRDALERVLLAFSWSDAPLLLAGVFVATAIGHFVTRAVVETAWAELRGRPGAVGPPAGATQPAK